MLLHSCYPGSGDADFAVIPARDEQAVKQVDRAVTGDDTQFKIDWTKLVGEGIAVGGQLATGGAIQPLKETPGTKGVDKFAALIGWAEHNHSTKAVILVPGKVAAHQDAAKRMGDTVDTLTFAQLSVSHGRAKRRFAEGGDGGATGGILDIEDVKAGSGQGRRHFSHACPGATEAVQ